METTAVPVAVVTGAAQGIGRQVAEALAGEGYALALTDLREPAETLEAVRGRGAEALTAVGDVTSQADVAALAEQVRRQFGGASVLVNNAGISLLAPAEQTTPAQWRRVLEVNLTGPFLLCQQFGAMMLGAGNGSIVNIASIAGLRGIADRAAYNASKHGLVGLTRTLAAEWGGRGVRVNAVCPGWAKTRDGHHRPGERRLQRRRHRRTGAHGPVRHARGRCRGGGVPGRPGAQRVHQRSRPAGGRRLDRRCQLDRPAPAQTPDLTRSS